MKYKILRTIIIRPASIAPHHFTADPGDVVHLVHKPSATCFRVSFIENPEHRNSDDIFSVAASEVEELPEMQPA